MDPSVLAALTLSFIGYLAGSVRIVQQGEEGLVERLGQYRRTLRPGLNFVIPFLDKVYMEETRERLLEIEPQTALTSDNVTISVDAVMFWKILDLQKAFYGIDNLEQALKNLAVNTLRSEIGQMDLRQTVSSRNQINQALLHQLDEATEPWGVKVTRVEVQEITISEALRKSLEAERAAEANRRAKILETEGVVESIEMLSKVLKAQPNADAVMKYLIAQRYVDANYRLGESANSKIIFMDPKALTETVSELIAADQNDNYFNGDNGNQPPPTS
jgi:regulator of protease activity HflC (stomatin/prohibitin superfamily)